MAKEKIGIIKKSLCAMLSASVVAISLIPTVSADFALSEQNSDWGNPFVDVTPDMWSYKYVTELNKNGIIPSYRVFDGGRVEYRGNVARYLYNVYLALGGSKISEIRWDFTDVPPENEFSEEVSWIYENGIMEGLLPTEFAPYSPMTRDQICGVIIKFANKLNIPLEKKQEPDLFNDAASISQTMKSYVTACRMCGMINGDGQNNFRPKDILTRNEAAAIIYNLCALADAPPAYGTELVLTGESDYSYLYPFVPLVPESEAVGDEWFSNVVFVGDSVTEGLKLFRGNLIPDAKFVSAGSLSASNILSGQMVPTYQGVPTELCDGIRQSGAKAVYVMLGMNNISFGLETSTGDMFKVLNNIAYENPDVAIVVQSVTPMAATSNIIGSKLNNNAIREYNNKMLEMCAENNWYYVNVAEAVTDANGNLISSYCSDANGMGIHFGSGGVSAWVNYLKKHVPEALK